MCCKLNLQKSPYEHKNGLVQYKNFTLQINVKQEPMHLRQNKREISVRRKTGRCLIKYVQQKWGGGIGKVRAGVEVKAKWQVMEQIKITQFSSVPGENEKLSVFVY